MKTHIFSIFGASAMALTAGMASADQVFNDDIIVDGSACIGQDCSNGESFGFDTIRLKENNLRIRFFDTSTSASFPTRDWQITANDSTNGGADKFSIDDIDGGKTPFTIEANAPSHSLYADDGGRVGFGTNTPVVSLHVKKGNTPTLRLEQDGSSGFTPQTWDLASNEANFFVRDATNGSTLPFRIKPGAPTNAVYIDSTGEIGMNVGTDPRARLHISNGGVVYSPSTEDDMIVQDDGPARLVLVNTTATNPNWIFNSNDTLRISAGTDSSEFTLDEEGNLTVTGNIISGGTGTCNPGPCDRVFDPEHYTVPSIEDHAAFMWQNKRLPALDPTLPGQPFNMTLKVTRMLNELEHAHIYIEQLNSEIKTIRAEHAEQIAVLAERLEQSGIE